MSKINNPYLGMEGYNCFGCAPGNHAGLQLEFRYEQSCVLAEWKPSARFAGYHQVLHGGVQAALADETAAWLVMIALDTSGMTNSLSIRYFKPLYVSDSHVGICASLAAATNKEANAMVSLADSRGDVCSIAEVCFSVFPPALARKKLHFPGREAFIS